MISYDSQSRFPLPPDVLTSHACAQLINDVLNDPDNHAAKTHFNDPEVREALKEAHGSKCAFCESAGDGANTFFEIDHFRPKKGVRDADPAKHKGYFWLSYEWTNLIQVCKPCNTFKSNQFPLAKGKESARVKYSATAAKPKNRRIDSPVLAAEPRLLLHPELDVVEASLEFRFNGEVVALDEKGSATIEVCELNRPGLVFERKRKIDLFREDLIDILNDFEDRGGDALAEKFLMIDLKKYFMRMLRTQTSDQPYSRVGFFMFHHFDKFYIDYLPDDLDQHKELLKKFYRLITTV